MTLKPVLSRYEVLGSLATGGMAQVWLARARGMAGFEKLVVVKTILPALAANPQFVAMFVNEGRLAAMLNHPNCVQIFDLGQEDGALYLAMEFLDGFSFGRVVKKAREKGLPFTEPLVARVMMDACSGLDYAHRLTDREGRHLGIVHRDVSPDNLLVSFAGQTKVVDFGIAKAATPALLASTTSFGQVKGKQGFIAPEYLLGRPIDGRADVFALGVVMYRALTAKRPFAGATETEVSMEVIEKTPKAPLEWVPSLTPALSDVVMKALEKDPAARWQSAREFRQAIDGAIARPSDSEMLADFMEALWPAGDPERVAMSSLAAGNADETSSPVLRHLTSGSFVAVGAIPPAPAPGPAEAPAPLPTATAVLPPGMALHAAMTVPGITPRAEALRIASSGPSSLDGAVMATPAGGHVQPAGARAGFTESATPAALAPSMPEAMTTRIAPPSDAALAELRAPADSLPTRVVPPGTNPALRGGLAGPSEEALAQLRGEAPSPRPVTVHPFAPAAKPEAQGAAPQPVFPQVAFDAQPPAAAPPPVERPAPGPAFPQVSFDSQPSLPVAATPAPTAPTAPGPVFEPAVPPEDVADDDAAAAALRGGKTRWVVVALLVLAALGGGVAMLLLDPDKPSLAPPPTAAPVPATPAAAPPAAATTGHLSLTPEVPVKVFNGKDELGTTPLELDLPPGAYSLRLLGPAAGVDQLAEVTVVAGETAAVTALQKGALVFRAKPYATVKWNGKVLGETPIGPKAAYEGVHSVELSNSMLRETRRLQVKVKAGETRTVTIDFEAEE